MDDPQYQGRGREYPSGTIGSEKCPRSAPTLGGMADTSKEGGDMSTVLRTYSDDRGRPIGEGDTVQVLYVDRARGAELWMHRGEVVGFGRSRVRVLFQGACAVYNVGAECLRVVES